MVPTDQVAEKQACEEPRQGHELKSWRCLVFYLCFFGFMAQLRPGESFITPHLLNNFTIEQACCCQRAGELWCGLGVLAWLDTWTAEAVGVIGARDTGFVVSLALPCPATSCYSEHTERLDLDWLG